MMVKPSVTELLKKVDNQFELVAMTAKRARQLSNGAKPLTNKDEESTVTLAADEIAEGKVVIVEEPEDEFDNENGEE
jgi:DNA-directed RNA polymerase subunit omega